MPFFFSFLSFSFKLRERERERERVYKTWYKETVPRVLILFFFLWSSWRIFLLLRANRLYAIFDTGLKNLGPSCPRYSFVFFTRSTGFWSVCHEPCPITNFSYFLFPLMGRSPHFRFRFPANHLASTFLLPVSGDPSEVTKYKHLWVSPLWPTFFLNGHTLMACYY